MCAIVRHSALSETLAHYSAGGAPMRRTALGGVWGEERSALFALFGAFMLVLTNILVTLLLVVFVLHWRTSGHEYLFQFPVFGLKC